MRPNPQTRQSPAATGLRVAQEYHGERNSSSVTSSRPAVYAADAVEVFKAAHGGRFTPSGNGWRARCPCCDDGRGALSVTERDGWLLAHCFRCGAERSAILAAVGLRIADIGPPRTWPPSKDDRRAWSRARREAGWSAALDVAALESRVALIAARDVHYLGGLQSSGDLERLALAVSRLESAATLLGGAR